MRFRSINCAYLDTKRPPFGTPLLKFLWFFEESAVPSSSFHIPSSSTGWFALRMMEDVGRLSWWWRHWSRPMITTSGQRWRHWPGGAYLCQGRIQIPQHLPILLRARSACFISLLIVSRPSSMWSSCSVIIRCYEIANLKFWWRTKYFMFNINIHNSQ